MCAVLPRHRLCRGFLAGYAYHCGQQGGDQGHGGGDKEHRVLVEVLSGEAGQHRPDR
jgi:hypothetical protein